MGWVGGEGGGGHTMTGKTQGLIHEARAIVKKVLRAEMMKRERFRDRQMMASGLKAGDKLGDPVILMQNYLNALKANDFNESKCAEEEEKIRAAADIAARDAKKILHKRLAEKAQRKNMVAKVETGLNELKRKSRSGG